MLIYPSCQAEIALLTSEEYRILAEYFELSNVFSSDLAGGLPEYTRINDHSIDLLDNKQPPYSSIYSLGLVKLEY